MKWFRNLRMMHKVMLPVGALLILTLAGIESISAKKSSDAIEKVARKELAALAENYSGKIMNYMTYAQGQAQGLASSFAEMRRQNIPLSRDSAIAMLVGLINGDNNFIGGSNGWEPDAFDGRDAEFAGTELHDKTGRLIPYAFRAGGGIKVVPLAEYNIPGDGDYYLKPIETRRPYITPPYSYEVDGQTLMLTTIGVPVIVSGRPLGVVCVDMPITTVNNLVAGLRPYEEGYAWLMMPDGNIIYHPDEDLQGKNIFDAAELEDESGLKMAMREGRPFQEVRVASATGFKSLVQYVPVEFKDSGQFWYLAVSAPMDRILADASTLTRDLLLVGVAALVLVMIAIYLVARSISKPIVAITDAAREVAGGNFEVQADESQFGGELYDLNISLRDMLAALVDNIARSGKMAEEAQAQTSRAQEALREADEARAEAENARREGMLHAADQLSGIVSQVMSASRQLTAEIDESSRGSDVQRDRTSESATAMEQMNASVLEVARNASEAAESAEKARFEAENGGAVVNDVVERINRIQAMTVEMEKGLAMLGEQAEGIGQIMGVISDIADQTNLLALNAAIEAARAGEAGRGFAVVADEVRKLAEKTMDATNQVGDFIRAIQRGTRDNIEGMSKAAAQVEQGTEYAGKAGDALSRIVEIVEETASQVRSIATASEEQSAASEQINRGIEEVNVIAGDNAKSMRESAAAVEELMGLGEQLTAVIEELRKA
ncbi:methyl-accepting chemotaxis protein [Maridesulfovibrio sp. FT414]|uniref:methyl-accepting chemotaxis protein n=1 Tax=Maridesulfovibrio sp. FT414 TaxID=2979469 RepID=UPI003D8037FF